MGHSFKILLLLGLCMLPNGFALPTNYGEDEQYREHCVRMTPENEKKVSAIVIKLSEFLYNLSLEYEEFDISLAKIIIDGHSESEEDEKELHIQLIVNDCASDDVKQATANASELMSRNDDGVADEELVGMLELDFSQSDDQEESEEDSPESESSSENKRKPSKTKNSQDARKIVTSVYENVEKSDNKALVENSEEVPKEFSQSDDKDEESEEDSPESESSNGNEGTRQPSKANIGQDVRKIPAPVYENVVKSDKAVVDNSEKVNQEEDQAISPGDVKAPELIRLEFDENGRQLIESYQKKLGKKPLVVYVQKLRDNNMSYLFLN